VEGRVGERPRPGREFSFRSQALHIS
jgi:hypothetical protein